MSNSTAPQQPRFQVVDPAAKPVIDPRITTDNATGLQWQTVCFDKRMTYAQAEQACRELRLGGHDDWRLPTLQELESIRDLSRVNPAIDIDAFPDTPSEWFWTSTPYAGDKSNAWFVNFGYGHSSLNLRDHGNRVRAVRGVARQSFASLAG